MLDFKYPQLYFINNVSSSFMIRINEKILNAIRLNFSFKHTTYCTQLNMFVVYYTKVKYKIMDTEVFTFCVNTINLILQKVKYIWNVRYNGECLTQGGTEKMKLNCFPGGKT
jgi:hypothetical protein